MTLLEVLIEGDAEGKIFTLPLPCIHISDRFFDAQELQIFWENWLNWILHKGHVLVVFERGQQRKIFVPLLCRKKRCLSRKNPGKLAMP